MNFYTKMSAKGQVVIPKSVRDELGIVPGQILDVTKTAAGVLLRPANGRPARDFDGVMADIRKITRRYDGPVVSVDEINRTITEGWAKLGSRDG